MILNFTNLAFYTPDTLTLTLKGAGTVTKALADVTISGNKITYNPTAAEKTTLGTGTVYAQVKFTAGTEYLKSEVLRLSANDLDNEIKAEITITEDFAAEIAVLKDLVDGKVSKSGDTMTGILEIDRGTNDSAAMVIRHTSAKGVAPTVNQAKYIQFNGSGSGLIGILHDSVSTANNSEIDLRAYNNAPGATCYAMIRVVHPANGNAYADFYRSADSTLGLSSYGPYNLLHGGNYSSYALPITGGTLTGNITIRHTIVTSGTAPSSTSYRSVIFGDKSGTDTSTRIGILESYIGQNNISATYMAAYANTAGVSSYAALRVEKPASGNGTVYFYDGGSYELWHQRNCGRVAISYTPTITYSAGTNPTVANISASYYQVMESVLFVSVRFQLTELGAPNGALRISLPTPKHTYVSTVGAVGTITSPATAAMLPWQWTLRTNSSVPCIEIVRNPGGGTFTATSQLATGYYTVGAVIPY